MFVSGATICPRTSITIRFITLLLAEITISSSRVAVIVAPILLALSIL